MVTTNCIKNCWVAILFMTPLLWTQAVDGATCPLAEEIGPCTCATQNMEDLNVDCHGPTINQSTINRLFSALRSANGVSDDQWLHLTDFHLVDTLLTELDLTPFLGSTFDNMWVYSNANLTRFFDPQLNSSSLALEMTHIYLDDNNLGDTGIHDLLHLLANSSSTRELRIPNNFIHGQLNDEFIQGLSYLTQLTDLDLRDNQIESIGGGQFRMNSQLEWLYMENVGLTHIGEHAFQFDSVYNGSHFLEINLSNNKLSDDSFTTSTDLDTTSRQLQIWLYGNQFEFISREKFEGIFFANELNYIDFEYNAFVCDQRMKWVKDARQSLEPRVTGIDCTNDPGKTIFTTDLV